MESISFDFAADVYDSTRAFPEGIPSKVAESLIAAIPEASDLLEVGIGTGRITRPVLEAISGHDSGLATRRMRIFGVDVSQRMLARLQAQLAPNAPKPHLIMGSGLALPFLEESFDAVMMVHFLHLVLDWKAALDESHRVLNRRGALFIGYETGNGNTPISQLRKQLQDLALERVPDYGQFGPGTADERTEWLISTGAVQDIIEAATWVESAHIGQVIDTYAQGIHSATWRIPAELRKEVFDRLRAWAITEFGSLDVSFEVTRRFVWERFRWNT